MSRVRRIPSRSHSYMVKTFEPFICLSFPFSFVLFCCDQQLHYLHLTIYPKNEQRYDWSFLKHCYIYALLYGNINISIWNMSKATWIWSERCKAVIFYILCVAQSRHRAGGWAVCNEITRQSARAYCLAWKNQQTSKCKRGDVIFQNAKYN